MAKVEQMIVENASDEYLLHPDKVEEPVMEISVDGFTDFLKESNVLHSSWTKSGDPTYYSVFKRVVALEASHPLFASPFKELALSFKRINSFARASKGLVKVGEKQLNIREWSKFACSNSSNDFTGKPFFWDEFAVWDIMDNLLEDQDKTRAKNFWNFKEESNFLGFKWPARWAIFKHQIALEKADYTWFSEFMAGAPIETKISMVESWEHLLNAKEKLASNSEKEGYMFPKMILGYANNDPEVFSFLVKDHIPLDVIRKKEQYSTFSEIKTFPFPWREVILLQKLHFIAPERFSEEMIWKEGVDDPALLISEWMTLLIKERGVKEVLSSLVADWGNKNIYKEILLYSGAVKDIVLDQTNHVEVVNGLKDTLWEFLNNGTGRTIDEEIRQSFSLKPNISGTEKTVALVEAMKGLAKDLSWKVSKKDLGVVKEGVALKRAKEFTVRHYLANSVEKFMENPNLMVRFIVSEDISMLNDNTLKKIHQLMTNQNITDGDFYSAVSDFKTGSATPVSVAGRNPFKNNQGIVLDASLDFKDILKATDVDTNATPLEQFTGIIASAKPLTDAQCEVVLKTLADRIPVDLIMDAHWMEKIERKAFESETPFERYWRRAAPSWVLREEMQESKSRLPEDVRVTWDTEWLQFERSTIPTHWGEYLSLLDSREQVSFRIETGEILNAPASKEEMSLPYYGGAVKVTNFAPLKELVSRAAINGEISPFNPFIVAISVSEGSDDRQKFKTNDILVDAIDKGNLALTKYLLPANPLAAQDAEIPIVHIPPEIKDARHSYIKWCLEEQKEEASIGKLLLFKNVFSYSETEEGVKEMLSDKLDVETQLSAIKKTRAYQMHQQILEHGGFDGERWAADGDYNNIPLPFFSLVKYQNFASMSRPIGCDGLKKAILMDCFRAGSIPLKRKIANACLLYPSNKYTTRRFDFGDFSYEMLDVLPLETQANVVVQKMKDLCLSANFPFNKEEISKLITWVANTPFLLEEMTKTIDPQKTSLADDVHSAALIKKERTHRMMFVWQFISTRCSVDIAAVSLVEEMNVKWGKYFLKHDGSQYFTDVYNEIKKTTRDVAPPPAGNDWGDIDKEVKRITKNKTFGMLDSMMSKTKDVPVKQKKDTSVAELNQDIWTSDTFDFLCKFPSEYREEVNKIATTLHKIDFAIPEANALVQGFTAQLAFLRSQDQIKQLKGVYWEIKLGATKEEMSPFLEKIQNTLSQQLLELDEVIAKAAPIAKAMDLKAIERARVAEAVKAAATAQGAVL